MKPRAMRYSGPPAKGPSLPKPAAAPRPRIIEPARVGLVALALVALTLPSPRRLPPPWLPSRTPMAPRSRLRTGNRARQAADEEGRRQRDDQEREADGAAIAEIELPKGLAVHVGGHHFAGLVGPAARHDVDEVKVLEGPHHREHYRGFDDIHDERHFDKERRLPRRRPVDAGRLQELVGHAL